VAHRAGDDGRPVFKFAAKMSAVEAQLRKVSKSLRQIEQLEEKRAAGQVLNKDETEKVTKRAQLVADLKLLQSG
jgi:uncharacterized protein with WD repeat